MPDLIVEIIEERVMIPSAGGRLEGILSYPLDTPQFACLLAPPHPFMGGTLENNVLAHLSRALAQAGHICLRFNYRGVGASDGPPVDVLSGMQQFWATGHAPHDPLLIEDTQAATDWLRTNAPLPRVAIGYSFGASAAIASSMDDAAGFILILPTLSQHDFDRAARSTLPKQIIYSDDDFATPREKVEDWLTSVAEPKRSVCVPGGQHFFRGLEPRVAEICTSFVRECVLGGEDGH